MGTRGGVASILCHEMSKSAEGYDSPAFISANNDLKNEALKKTLAILGLGLAAGGGARALVGSRYLFGRPAPQLRPGIGGPSVLNVPYPVFTSDKEEEKARKRLGYSPMTKVSSFLDRKPRETPSFWRGDEAEKQTQIPWALPAWTIAGLGAVVGGSKLMGSYLANKRKRDLQDEIDAAKEQYQKALIGQYDPTRIPVVPRSQVNAMSKLSADDPAVRMGKDLDELADMIEKRSALISSQTGGKMVGIAGTLAALLALGGGYLSYRHTKDRSQTKLLDDAIKQRERERWSRRPTDIQAVPVPVHYTREGLTPIGALPAEQPALLQ